MLPLCRAMRAARRDLTAGAAPLGSTLSLSEREEISYSLVGAESLRSIAARMRRAPFDRQSRNKPQRLQKAIGPHKPMVPIGASASTQAVQTCRQSCVGELGGGETPPAIVARANSGMPQASLSVRREPLRVPPDHLSQSVHSGARSAEEGAAGAPSAHAWYAPLAALHAQNRHPRKDCRRRLDQRTPRIRERSE